MRFGVSASHDYSSYHGGIDPQVVIRDFQSTPTGRILAIIPREDHHEAEQIAQHICDLLNKDQGPLAQ